MCHDQMLTIIHDKMDHSKTTSPHLSHKTKAMDSFMKMLVAITGMIAHSHDDIQYAHYNLKIFQKIQITPLDPLQGCCVISKNHPRILHDNLPIVKNGQSTLTKAVLEGLEMCLDSLLPLPNEPILARPLSPI